MSSNTCKGCHTRVANPIICDSCKIAVHPACVSRSGHPQSNGTLVNCASLGDSSLSRSSPMVDDVLFGKLKELICSELDRFKKEFREMYLADISNITGQVESLTKRVTEIENSLASITPKESENLNIEEVIEEVLDRERRSSQLIFFNMDEASANSTDEGSVSEILGQILQDDRLDSIKTTRLGRRKEGSNRPLKVILPNKEIARKVLKSKWKYKGPVKIMQDRTTGERLYLRELRDKLKALIDLGVTNKSIRYINGVPKIVDVNLNLVKRKN